MPVAETFVAPTRPSPGTPTPEALLRLQAAVNKVPSRPAAPAATPRPAQAAPQPGEKSRFGINSLINKMTGGQTGGEPAPFSGARAQPPLQAQPHRAAEPEAESDHDRIEIPAFLRRQAN